MRQLTYKDADGLNWRVELPEGADDKEAPLGIPVGPPDVRELNLPSELAKRLHFELAGRGLYSYNDVLKAGGIRNILAAWQAALQMDASQIMLLYLHENGNGHKR